MNLEEIYGKFPDFEYRTRIPTNNKVELFGINDAPFYVKPSILGTQIKHPAYQVWQDMLRRCFNNKLKQQNVSYIDSNCCEEWLHFTNFAKWFKDNYIKGHQLDKDMLVKNNTTYSPDTCIFISQELNLFLTLRDKCRGSLPLGVSLSGNKYVSGINSKKVSRNFF